MDDEDHVTCLIGEDGILMACRVVEEKFDVLHGFFGGFGLAVAVMELSEVSIVESTARP
jgi:hypothetical protein